MISDEELKRAAECDIESEVTQFCGVIGPSVIDPKVMLEAGIKTQEMARELLQLREEKRQAEEARAKSWKGAPEWAKYRARDSDWYGYYFEERPTPLTHDWRVTGRIADWASIPFESTLETRP